MQKDLGVRIDPTWGQAFLNSADRTTKAYGEYAIRLDAIEYEVCVEEQTYLSNGDSVVEYEFVAQTYDKRVCQYNFAVTAPYMIQK